MANTKQSKSGGMSLPAFLLVLLALAGIAAGVWLVFTKKANAGRNNYTFTMQVGDQKTLEAMLEHDYTCVSSAEGVVYIAPGTRQLLAKSAGEATVVAKDSVTGASQTFVVTVVENPDHPGETVTHTVRTEATTTTTSETTVSETTTVPAGVVTGISLSYYSAAIKVGETHPYAVVTMEPADATDKSELWSTSDDKVAVVDKAGRITGVGAGQCKIRVTSVSNPFVFAEIEVTVADQSTTTTETTTTAASDESGTTGSESGSSSQTGTTAASGSGTVQNTANPNIEVRDGVTYVNGVLIANKTYGLPADYPKSGGVDKDAQAAFNEMQKAAAKEGISLWICSGFRSYATQKTLYDNYCKRDGKAAADRYSARPGHSEHQTGLGLDINRAGQAFNGTKEQKWLAANCVKYGFIIRYPEGKENVTGYMYESWHIRYLGKDLAKKVSDSGLTLEEYLGITSKYAN